MYRYKSCIKKATTNYILYSHMMICIFVLSGTSCCLSSELKKLNTNAFYISGTMIEKKPVIYNLDCGNDLKNFDENKLLNNFNQ